MKLPNLTPVKSSALSGHYYDSDAGELHIGFNSGHRHVYAGVPKAVADGLASAPSAGTYFHRSIRDAFKSRKA